MPTLETTLKDLETLVGSVISVDDLDKRLDWVKGELKEVDLRTGILKIELNDTNRPDLWCVEGIARQLRGGKSASGRPWSQLVQSSAPTFLVRTSPSVQKVRPVIGGFIARGPRLGVNGLAQLIGTQERLSELFGRKRADIAIGVYPHGSFAFPLLYEAVSPDTTSFVPLGSDSSLTLQEILQIHPKGRMYGKLLSGYHQYPVLKDHHGKILSFPPITNARETGEVTEENQELFVEATGFDPDRIRLVLNIFAANLFDRGFVIEQVSVEDGETQTVYPSSTPSEILVPGSLPGQVTGETIDDLSFQSELLRYGYDRVEITPEGFRVYAPFYRDDLLHPVDCVEDFLIARGYDSFSPLLPDSFTAGRESSSRAVEDKVRELMVGLGFQELLSNVLTALERDSVDLGRTADRSVEIDNPVSRQYGVVRSTLLSFLLLSEAQSSRFPYPHRLFEVGEALEKSPGSPSSIREKRLFSGLIAHPTASISEMAGIILEILRYLGWEPFLDSRDASPFIPGRSGAIMIPGRSTPIGEIGEVHPEWLEKWGIRMPTVLFEVDLGQLYPNIFPETPGKTG
ncbi:MAG: phenylalanine--tRNA ligase subunit beta [Leptospirales bacterium]